MTTCRQEVLGDLCEEANKHGGQRGSWRSQLPLPWELAENLGGLWLSVVHGTGHPRKGFALFPRPLRSSGTHLI